MIQVWMFICEADGDAGRGLLWSSLRRLLVRASPADSDSTFVISISLPPDATWTTLMVALKIYHLFILRVTKSYKINWPMKVCERKYMMRRGCFTTLFTTYLTHTNLNIFSESEPGLRVYLHLTGDSVWTAKTSIWTKMKHQQISTVSHTIWKECTKYASTSNCFYIRTCLNNLTFIIHNGCRYVY